MISNLHLEMTSRCALRCPRCPRTMHPNSYKIAELDLEILEQVLRDPALLTGARLILAGNYGDAIYHSRLPQAVKMIKQHGFFVDLETNGTGRSKDWWADLISPLNKQDSVTFSVDGLEDTLNIYRVGARWNDVMNAVQVCRDHVTLEWKFILFRHNQHQVQEAEALSKTLGFNVFKIVRSNRFGPYWSQSTSGEDPMEPLEEPGSSKGGPSSHALQGEKKQIHARCLVESTHYISAEGLYFPSCWLGIFHDLRGSFLETRLPELSLKNQTLSEVLESAVIQDLKKSWENWETAPSPCRYACSKKLAGRTLNQFEIK